MLGQLLLRQLTSRPVTALMHHLLGPYATIYMIHRPPSLEGAYEGLTPALLEEAINHARNTGFVFAALDDVVTQALAGNKPKAPTLCFTLDDGYQDQLDQLLPVLLQYNCKPTMFVIVDMIDGKDWPWDSKLSYALWHTPLKKLDFNFLNIPVELDLSNNEARKRARRQLTLMGKGLRTEAFTAFVEQILLALKVDVQHPPQAFKPATWETLRHAEVQGLRIGSHACSHRVFSSMTDAEVNIELERAKTRLATELKNPSQIFCYPSGTKQDFSAIHSALVESAGYLGAVSSISGNISQKEICKNPFRINRHSFPSNLHKFVRYSSWLEYLRSKF